MKWPWQWPWGRWLGKTEATAPPAEIGTATTATATATTTAVQAQGRISGPPTSSNGASSMHLRWLLAGRPAIVEVSATLTVVVPPSVDRLYFWALQVSFEQQGRRFGGAHLGLQWHPGHPGHTAANWGGYRPEGGELDGSVSPRPPVRGNANTRDYDWLPARPYRLTVRRAADGSGWEGLVDGEPLRVLFAGGDRLTNLMVWSEVFARCDEPSVTVRWSDFEARTDTGEIVHPTAVATSYQTFANGGCDNTTAVAEGRAVLQVTNAPRQVPPDTTIHLG